MIENDKDFKTWIAENSYKDLKVIIAGGRDFNDYDFLETRCDVLLQEKETKYNIIIISGTARGADSLGERYAQNKGYKLEKYPAQWNKYGKSAGYKRNQQMAKITDALIAFWDGESKGTSHMINIMKSENKKFRIIKY